MSVSHTIIALLIFLTTYAYADENTETKEATKMDTALLIIDAQVNMWESEYSLHSGEQLLAKLGTLITNARRAGILVIHIQNNGGPGDPDEPGTKGWEIHPKLTPADGEIVVQKDQPSAFQNTNLPQILRERGIGNLIIVGMQTEMCVKANCVSAVQNDYNVILVEDAHSTFDRDSETAAQIIERHNKELGSLLNLKKMKDLPFVSP